jgi:hypothetical protein
MDSVPPRTCLMMFQREDITLCEEVLEATVPWLLGAI